MESWLAVSSGAMVETLLDQLNLMEPRRVVFLGATVESLVELDAAESTERAK